VYTVYTCIEDTTGAMMAAAPLSLSITGVVYTQTLYCQVND